MKIISNALPQDANAPFLEANKVFCDTFERFVTKKNGTVEGTYNAGSYVVYGQIKANYLWDLKYKRASYPTKRSIFSALVRKDKFQTIVQWTCNDVQCKKAAVFIRKRKSTDRLKPAYKRMELFPHYVKKQRGKNAPLLTAFLQILCPLFESEELHRITLKHNKLTIELRDTEHHFEILEKLLNVNVDKEKRI